MRLYCMTLGRAVNIDCPVFVLNEQLCSQMLSSHGQRHTVSAQAALLSPCAAFT